MSILRNIFVVATMFATCTPLQGQTDIPLPEHPRPDFERPAWLNLNGTWQFRFDPGDEGLEQSWQSGQVDFPLKITVPFPWGSPLSGVADSSQLGWYSRALRLPPEWEGRRVFLVVGASDWHTTAWLGERKLGEHRGGYTPFSFELTPYLRPGETDRLTLRVDDIDRDYKLEGKQGYGNARGIWQTPYLEARGDIFLTSLHFAPDIDREVARVTAHISEAAHSSLTLDLTFKTGGLSPVRHSIPEGAIESTFEVPVTDPRLWSLADPFLYEVQAELSGPDLRTDFVHTYFGMRKISVVDLPGTDIPYIALNDTPVYLQMALDQAYHPEGYYTFPDDAFTRDEILRARQIGLNGLRIHVKIGLPRKLYWADRLGILIMADVPNSWGEPTVEMQREVEYALQQMITRDFNHPSIFAWVPFNETWGLYSKVRESEGGEPEYAYLAGTQDWVAEMYQLAKRLDPTRLVEDNSVCCGRGHTQTDINSWHAYLPGWAWEDHLDSIAANTYPGSGWNFESGYRQARQPNLNSEFGNVWGYEGSTGDVDWSWDYHRAVNAFRRHPKVAGWLYTEHHDVVNEWNGYWRFDRTTKETGLGEIVEGMTLSDLHAPVYVAAGEPAELSRQVMVGDTVNVPLWISCLDRGLTEDAHLWLKARLDMVNTIGLKTTSWSSVRELTLGPWVSEGLPAMRVPMPAEPGLAVLAVVLEDASGSVLHRNFTTFVVDGAAPEEMLLENGRKVALARFVPAAFVDSEWSQKQWQVLDGLKVNGAGFGHFTYDVPWPVGLRPQDVESVNLLVEASAKQLFGKDRDSDEQVQGDFMRGGGSADPSLNPNAYPMTDETTFPSAVLVTINGVAAGRFELDDDPADHRGILSWHAQLRDRKLREAGSYGQLLKVRVPATALRDSRPGDSLRIHFAVDVALPGGLAIYGRRFGRYPLDPTLVFVLKETD